MAAEIRTTELAERLLAAIDETERPAREGLCINCGLSIVPLRSALGITGYVHDAPWEGVRCPHRITGATAVQNAPAVLRRCQADRETVNEYVLACTIHQAHREGDETTCVARIEEVLRHVVERLAKVYDITAEEGSHG